MLRALLFALGATAVGFQIGFAILLVAYGSRAGDAVKAACIRGQITEEQAYALNTTRWKRVPNYCIDNTYTDDYGWQHQGESPCWAMPGDRILSGSCSQALKSLFSGD